VESRALMEMAVNRELTLVVSDLLLAELAGAPERVQQVLLDLPAESKRFVSTTTEAIRLRQEYLNAGVVRKASSNDARHVAIATVEAVDLIASWNFKHIVHFDKIRRYNAVNLREGYGVMEIRSPKEIV
jgi:hypothetical protein